METLKRRLEESIGPNQRLRAATIRKRVPGITDDEIQSLADEGFLTRSYSIRDPNEGTELVAKKSEKELEFFKRSKPCLKNPDTGAEYGAEELLICEVFALANPYASFDGLEPIRDKWLQDVTIFACDLVSFSEAPSIDQYAQFEALGSVLSKAADRAGLHANTTFGIPTGDGYFLVLNPDNAERLFQFVDLFVQMSRVSDPRLPMRIGVHSGSLYVILHRNNRRNAIGHSINAAARIMGFGDDGHVIVSRDFYELRLKGTSIQERFHPCGTAADKHGHKYDLLSYYHDDIGNPEPPSRTTATDQEGPLQR